MKKRIITFVLSISLMALNMMAATGVLSGGTVLVQAEESSEEIFFETDSPEAGFSDYSEEPVEEMETPAVDDASAAETGMAEVVSVELLPDDGLEMVPVPMLSCLEDLHAVKAKLSYSDGTEQILCGDTDSYGNTCQVTYEDMVLEDGSVSRTYTAKVIPVHTADERSLESSQTIVFPQHVGEEPEDIAAETKTKVSIPNKKNWLLVQAVPQATGKYSLQSFGRDIKELYYLADGETEVRKADGSLELTEGISYVFLLKLEEQSR